MKTRTPHRGSKGVTKLRSTLCLSLILVCAFTGLIPTRNAISANDERNSSQPKLVASPDEPMTMESIDETYEKLPLSFEENRGQFDKRVRFFTRGRGYGLFLTADEMVYVLRQKEREKERRGEGEKNNESQTITSSPFHPFTPSAHRAVALRIRLVDAGTNSSFVNIDELPGRINYFKGNTPDLWQTDIRAFQRVRYESVWQGVDLHFYSNSQGDFEYDFIVGPQINHNRIALEIEGAEDVRLDQNGNLEIETEVGTITQRKPFTYQETDGLKQEIQSGYKVEATDNGGRSTDKFRISFEVSNYDANKPLVIDPSVNLNNLSFSTFLGGASDEFEPSLAVDNAGNIYATGRTFSELFPTTSGAFDPSLNGGSDVFVTKLNASGTALIYSTFIGSSGTDNSFDIALDGSGNAYITGNTIDSTVDYPTTVGAFDTTHNGGVDVFVTKLNITGTALVYSTFVGGGNNESAISIAVDISGNAYTTGQVLSSNYPTTAGAFDTSLNGSFDAFVTKLNATGSALDYSTYIGGSDFDTGYGITVDLLQK
jgi:hypothetical protein